MIRFEGGNSCFSEETCESRWNDAHPFMTTAATPIIYEDPEGGIYNGSPEKNPDWHDYNMISGHYCSSDAWSGQIPEEESSLGYHFRGHANVIGVFEEALAKYDLGSAERVIVFGFSAGGIGIMSGQEYIQEWFAANVPDAELFFLMDSSWFIESLEYLGNGTCHSQDSCPLADQMHYALENWGSYYSENCAAFYSEEDQWKCMIPEYSFQTMEGTEKFFILQNFYDSMQANLHTADGAGDLQTEEWWASMADITLDTLQANVNGFWAAGCTNHDNVNRNWMYEITIDGVFLSEKVLEYYDSVYPIGDRLEWYEDAFDSNGDVCKACNPTCPDPTEPPHTHELTGGGG
jgi:hypothetical protein